MEQGFLTGGFTISGGISFVMENAGWHHDMLQQLRRYTLSSQRDNVVPLCKSKDRFTGELCEHSMITTSFYIVHLQMIFIKNT